MKVTRKAFTLIYTGLSLGALTGIISLSVDFGRVQVAKAQLASAVDAAARYAASGISDGTYVTKAQTAAAANPVDTGTLTLLAGDVELGTWNTTSRTFAVGGATPNALRVTGRLTAGRGTPIPTPFLSLLGRTSTNLYSQSIVCATTSSSGSGGSSDVIGLNSVNLSGGALIRRLASESGTVRVGTNNTMALVPGTYIQGDAYYRTTNPTGPNSAYTGSKIAMTSDMSFPAPVVPSGATNLGAVNVDWQGLTLAAGNYTCTSLTFGGGGTVTLNGDVNIYCSGAVDIGNGCTINTSNGAKKFILNMTSNSTANVNMTSAFYMGFYGPSATLHLTGSSPMIGSAVTNNLNMDGSATLTYTSTLATAGGSGTTSTTVKMVK